MFEVKVEDNFAAAHFLRDYNGKCENLHGHNYKVFVTVRGNELNEGGMLIDFSLLKSELKKVISVLDHTNLNDIDFFEQNPSAERIAFYIYKNLEPAINQKISADASQSVSAQHTAAFIYSVRVFETEKNCATYYAD